MFAIVLAFRFKQVTLANPDHYFFGKYNLYAFASASPLIQKFLLQLIESIFFLYVVFSYNYGLIANVTKDLFFKSKRVYLATAKIRNITHLLILYVLTAIIMILPGFKQNSEFVNRYFLFDN